MQQHLRHNKFILCPSPSLRILLPATVLILFITRPAQAYIGPGAGFAVLGSFLVMFIAMFSAVLALFTWPVRYLIRAIRHRATYSKARIKRFIILGLDGMDPTLAEKLLAEEKLPNFERLRQKGCFKKLATTLPPLSPVAWSSFLTGSNPGKHNIFDFLTRDKRTYLPTLSSVGIYPPTRTLTLGKYQIPLGKPDIRPLRKGKPFWSILGEHQIFSNIIRVPITFPPEKFRGLLLSGMCVPDLQGSQGTFSFYTTKAEGDVEHISGQQFQLQMKNGSLKGQFIGPPNPFLKDNDIMNCPFEVTTDHSADEAVIKFNGQRHKLKKGTYTDWLPVEFKAAFGIKVHGICRILLLRTKPDFEMYVTPINIDPAKPAMPIAHPVFYSTYFAKRQGPFATLGLAEDTWALNAKILSDDDFIQQCKTSDTEREEMFFDALDKLRRGLCVCVFDGTDRIQHTFWRYMDDNHPARKEPTADTQHEKAIENLYQDMDRLVGRLIDEYDDEQTVITIISDHGFNSFRRGVDLNRWLEQNGYLYLKENDRDKKYLGAVDWSKTRAFALGLAGIYLNIKGREAQGIVQPGSEAQQLCDELAGKLTGLSDPETGQTAIKQAYDSSKVYTGPYKTEAPDIIVGYTKGYRVSWEAAVGQVTDKIFHDNIKAWSGDHCIDHTLVPGVLFCNRPIKTESPRLIDIGPTVLDMFGLTVPSYMDGRVLSLADTNEKESTSSIQKEGKLTQDSGGGEKQV
jgi:predicted AlkP superfamily phosphohydrolase/phosphomutase